jgi:hypothetical protein
VSRNPTGANRIRAALLSISVLLAVFLAAQDLLLPKAERLLPAGKRPVYVTASFRDKKDLFIENLGRDEVEVLEDGSPRKIEFMARDELPTVYGLLFDRAMFPESIEDERYSERAVTGALSARNMAYELIDKMLGKQSLWVGYYEKELRVILEESTDGFSAKNAIHEIRGRRRPEDAFLYPALFESAQRMNARLEKRRVLILFIEDMDNDTVSKFKPLKNLYGGSNIELFVVSYGTVLGTRTGRTGSTVTYSTLRELAQTTAGGAFFTREYRDHYEDLMRRMLNQIRTLYTFGIEAESGQGAAAKLQVRCLRPGSKVTFHPYVP